MSTPLLLRYSTLFWDLVNPITLSSFSFASCVIAVPTPPDAECIKIVSDFFKLEQLSNAKKAVQYCVAKAKAWPSEIIDGTSFIVEIFDFTYSCSKKLSR